MIHSLTNHVFGGGHPKKQVLFFCFIFFGKFPFQVFFFQTNQKPPPFSQERLLWDEVQQSIFPNLVGTINHWRGVNGENVLPL